MGVSYLWDTNIVIYFLQNQLSLSAGKFIAQSLKKHTPSISVITEIELLCWKTGSKKDHLVLQEFIDSIQVIELNQNIKLKTAEIRKNHKVKMPDAVIAATAITYGLSLLTRNVDDFKKIDNLDIINPFDANVPY